MPSRHEDLAEALTELKRRSGRSYAWIAERVNVSKAAVHRYCAGTIVPVEFGTLERIARACGADQAEIIELMRLWQRAVIKERPPPAPEPRAVPPPVVPPAVPQVAPPQAARRRSRAMVLIAVAVLAGVLLVATRSSDHATVLAQQELAVSGPAWAHRLEPVPPEFFGVTMNSSTGIMPSFRVGSVRLWDSHTRWSSVEPERGGYDWSDLDRMVGAAATQHLPVVYVFGGVPRWASPGGPLGPYADGSRTSPPDDLADWDDFVSHVVTRFAGRISAYELWAVANDPQFYTGSPETLVEMTRRAARTIRSADPKAVVVCPSMGRLWDAAGEAFMARFAALHGYDHCDVAGVKLHQRRAADPPETMLELAGRVDQQMHRAGIHPPIWSTGTTFAIALEAPLERTRATNYAVRFYLVGLYAQYSRMYFYNWGGTKVPIVLQPDGGAPTEAALAVERLQHWLAGAGIVSCGHGTAAGLPDVVWQCMFRTTPDGAPFTIRWSDRGTAWTRNNVTAVLLRHLDGTETPILPGDDVAVGEEPVRLDGAQATSS